MSSSKSLLFSAQSPKTTLHRYTVMSPRSEELPYLAQSAYTRVLNSTHNITFADLTQKQAAEIKQLLANGKGQIKINSQHQLKLPKITAKAENTRIAATNTYATAPATCSQITISSNFVMFFPDSMVDKTQFPNINLTIGNNYSGSNSPCNPHANYTLATFNQVLGSANLSRTNIPVFTCGGTVTDEAVINALLDILNYAKANPTKKIGMYFAVDPLPADATITATVQELVAAGVLVGLSSGNEGENVCNWNSPPQNVAGTLQIGATEAPGNQCPWWSNWSDITPNQQYGDCVQAYFPGVFKSQKFGVELEGTSFSIPQAVAWGMRWWSQNPNSSAQDVINALVNHTVVITKSATSPKPPRPPFTPTGEMRVVKTADYCNTNVTANTSSSSSKKANPS